MQLAPQSKTFVYLDMTTGTLRSNTSGFTANVYPIAIATTNTNEVIDLQDVRPDVPAVASGGGGSATDTVQAFSAPQIIVLAAGQNMFGTVVAAANGLSLPSTTGLGGQRITLIKTDTSGFVAIAGAANGTFYLSNQWQYVSFETDGTFWYVIGNN